MGIWGGRGVTVSTKRTNNNKEMVWVEVYVFDQEWVVEVYDMCDQDGLSEDVWRVMIGSNCQFIQL